MSKNRTAILNGLLAGSICAVAAHFGAALPLDAAWFRALAEAGAGNAPAAPPEWIGPALACLAGTGAALFHIHHPRLLATLLVLLAATVEIYVGSALAVMFGQAIPPTAPTAALLLGALFSSIAIRTAGARRFERLEAAFGDSASPSTIAAIQKSRIDLANPAPVEAGFITCRACNLRPMLDSLAPKDSARALRLVIGRAAEAAREAGAIVARCGPTGFDAICGLARGQGAAGSETAGFLLSLVENLREWNAECARISGYSIDIRLGAESGPALPFLDAETSGRARFASEAALVAERVCSANLEYGSIVAIGPRLQGEASESFEIRPLDFLPLGEGGAPVEIYEIIARKGALDEEQIARRDAYWRGVILFREGRYDEAIRAFQDATVIGVGDPPLAYYLEKAIRARSELPVAAAPRAL